MTRDETRRIAFEERPSPDGRPVIRMTHVIGVHTYVMDWVADPHGLLDYGRQLRRWEADPELNFGKLDKIYWSAFGIAMVRRLRANACSRPATDVAETDG